MKIIKTLNDLESLKNSQALPYNHFKLVESDFQELKEALGDGEKDFSLQEYGYLVILDKNDNLNSLPSVGLPQGLLNCWPEYIERYDLEDQSIYRIGILSDNDYMMFYYLEKGLWSPEIEAWLVQHTDYVLTGTSNEEVTGVDDPF